jgi:UDP-N-acetylglucosamine:LPS N-acetylglucosamine transferase
MVSINRATTQQTWWEGFQRLQQLPNLDQQKARKLLRQFGNNYHDFLAEQVRFGHLTGRQYIQKIEEGELLWKEAEEFVLSLPEGQLPFFLREKKKILILISEGGGGHRSAGESLKEILDPFHSVAMINVFKEVLYPLDTLQVATDGAITGEDFYNFALQLCLHRLLAWYVRIGRWYFLRRLATIESLFSHYLESFQARPDLIISTIPIVNLGLIRASCRQKIPFLLVPTDLQTTIFLNGFKRLKTEEKRYFKMALPYENPHVRLCVVKNSFLQAKDLEVTGFPVRSGCLKQYSPEEISKLRDKHGMKSHCQTVTLVAGAQGGELIFHHARAIAAIPLKNYEQPLEVNICTGHNERISQIIAHWALKEGAKTLVKNDHFITLQLSSGIIFHLRSFTREMVEIIACSRLLITKTGSCSVNEALYLKIPLLLDHTRGSSARTLWWEYFNIGFIQEIGCGEAFTESKQLVTLVPKFLRRKISLSRFSPPNFSKQALHLVDQMAHLRESKFYSDLKQH